MDDQIQSEKSSESQKWYRLKASIFLASVTGASLLFGFGMALAVAKKRDPTLFGKGLTSVKNAQESGGALAMKALGWGTLYSISGFSLCTFLVWKAMAVENLQEFRKKMQSIMPEIPKKVPQGRNDFNSLTDLMQYVIDESDKSKKS